MVPSSRHWPEKSLPRLQSYQEVKFLKDLLLPGALSPQYRPVHSTGSSKTHVHPTHKNIQ